MIEKHLSELADTWDFTVEEVNHIREKMAEYAIQVIFDVNIRKEASEIYQKVKNASA